MLKPEISQQTQAGGDFEPLHQQAPTGASVKQCVLHRQYMHGLHLPVPCIFMRMHDIKTATRSPRGSTGVPELVNPARPSEWRRNLVIGHSRPLMLNLLGKDVDFMTLCQLLNECDGV